MVGRPDEQAYRGPSELERRLDGRLDGAGAAGADGAAGTGDASAAGGAGGAAGACGAAGAGVAATTGAGGTSAGALTGGLVNGEELRGVDSPDVHFETAGSAGAAAGTDPVVPAAGAAGWEPDNPNFQPNLGRLVVDGAGSAGVLPDCSATGAAGFERPNCHLDGFASSADAVPAATIAVSAHTIACLMRTSVRSVPYRRLRAATPRTRSSARHALPNCGHTVR